MSAVTARGADHVAGVPGTPPDGLAALLAGDPGLAKLLDADRAIAKVGARIRVLNAIAWPVELEERFLSQWRAGRPELPAPATAPVSLDDEVARLDRVMKRLDRGHPVGEWLYKTAWSYRVAARMLAQIGQPGFTRCSVLLYGRPDRRYRTQDLSNADAAQQLLTITDQLIGPDQLPPVPCDTPAEEFAQRLRERIGPFFDADPVDVVLDPSLPSKATASSRRVRLRSTALFSDGDLEQLTQHEAFVHTATLLNGRHQPYLRCLGVGAPRTTRTQEGLATFAEIITGAMDIARLRRIALRVLRVRDALAGADFVDVFRGFLDAGQTEVESYRSASRVFRGGDVRGGLCFTKDGAYLEGLFSVHVFIRKALQEGRGHLLRMLFAGRVTTGDAITLAPYVDTLVARARYLPPWAREPQRVLSLMAFSVAASQFRLDGLDLQRFADVEDETIADAGSDY